MAKQIPQAGAAQNVSHESIARRAYEIWQSEGCPDGRAMEHWLCALSELKAQSQPNVSGQNGRTEQEREAANAKPETRSQPRLQNRKGGVERTPSRLSEKRFQTAGR